MTALLRRTLIVFLFACGALSVCAATRPPNLVFILTDNQGAWTLGCYGNPDIRTPHIDRLAAEGVRFTRALSSNPVCSPTRATFLTGLIPSQHGVHSFLDPKFMMGPQAYNTLREFTSLGEVLRDAGYTCGLSGKWHLGDNLHPSKGFSFWITKPDGHTTEFYNQDVIENGASNDAALPPTAATTVLRSADGYCEISLDTVGAP